MLGRSTARNTGEQLIGGGIGRPGVISMRTLRPVAGVRGAAYPAVAFEKVERCGHGG